MVEAQLKSIVGNEKMTLSQIEERCQKNESAQRHWWENGHLKEVTSPGQGFLSKAVADLWEGAGIPHKLLCATSFKVNSEYRGKVFDMAAEDASLSEKHRAEAKFLANEMKKRAKEDAVFEMAYIVVELWASGNTREAAGLFKEVKPQIGGLAKFYAADMDKKLKEGIVSHVSVPGVAKDLIAWNVIKSRVEEISPALEDMEKNFEGESPDRLWKIVRNLASVRWYEDELAVAHAKRSGVPVKVDEEIFKE